MNFDFDAFWAALLHRQQEQRRRKRELELTLMLLDAARGYVVQEGFVLN